MRILIDECLNFKVRHSLTDHLVSSVQRMGWSGIKNGKLLRLMEVEFDVFLTVDKNFEYQQNLDQFSIAIIVLYGKDIKLESLLPLMPKVRAALETIKAGDVVRIGPDT